MVHMTEIPPLDLLLAGCGTLLMFAFALAALSFDGWRRATRRQSQQIVTQAQTLAQQLSALDARVNATTNAIRRLDERIEQRAQPGPQPKGAPASGYQIAIRLARRGASREELMSNCGLSLGEAELLRTLHSAASGAGV
jgi:outer membrane murein-binding lipoprotein Lpp